MAIGMYTPIQWGCFVWRNLARYWNGVCELRAVQECYERLQHQQRQGVKWVKNDKLRARAKCTGECCQWMIFCGFNSNRKSFQIKTFNSEHTCCRFQNKKADTNWVIKKLVKKLRIHPQLRHSEAFDHMKEEYNVYINDKKIYRALKRARHLVEGSEKE